MSDDAPGREAPTVAPLGSSTWTDLDARVAPPLLVVPVGSFEQHGPHLPLATDTLVAEHLAADLVGRRADAVLGPSITVTASGEHQGFPGTLSIGTETTAAVIVELARSADWAAGTVLVNGHGGNVDAVRAALRVLDDEGRAVLAWSPHLDHGGDPHAGSVETSLMLALRPDLVRLDRAVPGPVPTIASLRRHGVRALSPTGVLGDPTGATADHGRTLLGRFADDLAGTVERWVASRGRR